MGQPNSRRTQVTEGGSTFVSRSLEKVLREIDSRISAADCYMAITRDGDDLIQQVDYFRDAAHTSLAIRRVYARITGFGGVKLISTITSTFYDEDGVTLDSTVTTTATRSADATFNRILSCDSPFTTSEDTRE